MSDGRRPTVDEAVAFLRSSITREYKRRCLIHWREKFGEAFAAQVKNAYLKTQKSTTKEQQHD